MTLYSPVGLLRLVLRANTWPWAGALKSVRLGLTWTDWVYDAEWSRLPRPTHRYGVHKSPLALRLCSATSTVRPIRPQSKHCPYKVVHVSRACHIVHGQVVSHSKCKKSELLGASFAHWHSIVVRSPHDQTRFGHACFALAWLSRLVRSDSGA